jgi:hypothetical protein
VGLQGRFATLGGFSKYDLHYPAKIKTTLAWSGSELNVGETFPLSTSATPMPNNVLHVHVDGASFFGSLSVLPDPSASLNANGCLGCCGE